MKQREFGPARSGVAITALALSFTLLAGCASTPETPAGAAGARSNLQELENDPNLAEWAGGERREAEEAVLLAEEPLPSSEDRLAEHRVYMANQKVEIARAKAATAYAEHQRQRLAEERDDERLASRTEEVDRARRGEAELQRQIDALQAKETERGIVLTLGDVLFTTGSANLQSGGYENLNRLVEFLNAYPDRDALIEGHTDSVGSAASNMQLSQRRADSVRDYLTRRGIDGQRLSARGMGEAQPVATNDTDAGRQQNRRVEIIIENAPQTSTAE
ncbi:OmpA family protein [Aquisalimonas sp.]|uniref:OmpA family protein n=1 Tax=unclassified Aquisalimonas TaxID=2644645 RepID=UPI0025C54A73|nr:OmpA family protein [Aquisalimonas sp.]